MFLSMNKNTGCIDIYGVYVYGEGEGRHMAYILALLFLYYAYKEKQLNVFPKIGTGNKCSLRVQYNTMVQIEPNQVPSADIIVNKMCSVRC